MLHLKKKDKVLARIISHVGPIEVKMHDNRYEAIVHAFINQQISGAAADSIMKKFKAMYNGRLPKPKEFLLTPEKKIRSVGISPQKYSYIKGLCERIESKELDLKNLDKLPDEEVIAILDDIKGIGRWTAEMFLMFSLGRTNLFPSDDLGIQNAVHRAYKLKKRPDKNALDRMSERFAPYKSVAALYLWRSIDPKEDW